MTWTAYNLLRCLIVLKLNFVDYWYFVFLALLDFQTKAFKGHMIPLAFQMWTFRVNWCSVSHYLCWWWVCTCIVWLFDYELILGRMGFFYLLYLLHRLSFIWCWLIFNCEVAEIIKGKNDFVSMLASGVCLCTCELYMHIIVLFSFIGLSFKCF